MQEVLIVTEQWKLETILQEASKRFPEMAINVWVNEGKVEMIKLQEVYDRPEVSFLKNPILTNWNALQMNLETQEAFLAPSMWIDIVKNLWIVMPWRTVIELNLKDFTEKYPTVV